MTSQATIRCQSVSVSQMRCLEVDRASPYIEERDRVREREREREGGEREREREREGGREREFRKIRFGKSHISLSYVERWISCEKVSPLIGHQEEVVCFQMLPPRPLIGNEKVMYLNIINCLSTVLLSKLCTEQ